MINTSILAPAAVLVVWSLIMLVWMAIVRAPVLAKIKLPPEKSRGARGSDLDGVVPGPAQWPAHNYAHLMEQPTLFYATVMILALAGAGQTDVMLAWAYVGLRVVHSIWQAAINTIPVRLLLFLISSIVLMVLAVRALLAVI